MKKAVPFILFAAFGSLLVGCGSSSETAPPIPATEAQGKGAVPDKILSNPNIPDSAKQAIKGGR